MPPRDKLLRFEFVIILGQPKFVLKNSAQFRPLFIITNRIVERQTYRVNLVNRDMDMHVVRVMVDDAHPLMFSVSQLLAKTLLDHPQRFGIGVFSGPERNKQMNQRRPSSGCGRPRTGGCGRFTG